MQQNCVPEGTILLQQWLKNHKMSINDFAKLLNLHYHVCWYWVMGKRCPELAKAVLIESATAIPCKSWTLFVGTEFLEKSYKKSHAKTGTNNKKKGDESS